MSDSSGSQSIKSLENVYRSHHATRRGDDFILLGSERGQFLRDTVGKNKKVLDIGCRDGALTALYAEGNEVIGLDIDQYALERAAKRGIKTKQVDLNGDWGISERFDVVVAAEVLEHLYYPGVVLGKIKAVLKPEGVLVGSIPNAFSLKSRLKYLFLKKKGTAMEDPTHINHFTVKEITGLLNEQFQSVRVMGIGRLGVFARYFPQLFAFDLIFEAKNPRF